MEKFGFKKTLPKEEMGVEGEKMLDKFLNQEKGVLEKFGAFGKGRIGKTIKMLTLLSTLSCGTIACGTLGGREKFSAQTPLCESSYGKPSIRELEEKELLPDLVAGLRELEKEQGTVFLGKIIETGKIIEIVKNEEGEMEEDNSELFIDGKKVEISKISMFLDGGSYNVSFLTSDNKNGYIKIANPHVDAVNRIYEKDSSFIIGIANQETGEEEFSSDIVFDTYYGKPMGYFFDVEEYNDYCQDKNEGNNS